MIQNEIEVLTPHSQSVFGINQCKKVSGKELFTEMYSKKYPILVLSL